jgi:hypothetical protein
MSFAPFRRQLFVPSYWRLTRGFRKRSSLSATGGFGIFNVRRKLLARGMSQLELRLALHLNVAFCSTVRSVGTLGDPITHLHSC